ncbi:hypothetical protein HMPREF0972_01918 [Actinomyces sp. oral taxon 848 str. F0332]|nr:hypothetical protein HMPREF0972_01918 [Actinomyces sp. oral taxon 848 str. F0332]
MTFSALARRSAKPIPERESFSFQVHSKGGQGVSRRRSPFCRSFRSDARRLKHQLFFLRVCANMLPKIHNSPFRPFRLAPLIR